MCANFWRTFVKSKWVMNWIDHGYDLVWDKFPPVAREIRNSKSSLDNHDFVTNAVTEMLEPGAVSVLPFGVIPTVVSPLGVVPKRNSNNLDQSST